MNQSPEVAARYLELAPDAIVLVDDAGIILSVNRQATELFGYRADELVGEAIEILIPTDVATRHRAHRTRYRAAPSVRQMGDPSARLEARRADGALVPVEVALSPVELDGRLTVMSVVRDISARVQAEAHHDLVRRSLDAVEDGVFMFDPKSLRFTYVNQGAANQVGYPVDELVGSMSPLHLDGSYSEAQFRELLAPLVDDELRSISIESHLTRRDGHDVPVEVVFQYPLLQAGGDRVVVALVRDVTRRVEAARRRNRDDRLRRALAELRMAALEELPIDALAERTIAAAVDLLDARHASLCHAVGSNRLVVDAVLGLPGPGQPIVEVGSGTKFASVLEQGEAIFADLAGNGSSPIPWLEGADRTEAGAGPLVLVPVTGPAGPEGILAVGRSEMSEAFDDDDLVIAAALASEVATIRRLGQARADRRSRSLAEDRERIARDLHDHVIQRLFAGGMRLQAALGAPDLLKDRARTTIAELDETIDVIRESIFQLTNPDLSTGGELERLVERHRATAAVTIDFHLTGSLDDVPDTVAEQLLAVVNELLSNVIRHAEATSASLSITVDDALTVVVTDDGVGLADGGPTTGGLGLRNLSRRAENLGGGLELVALDGGGTEATWRIPLG
ncbi:MAG: PAS domain S-box protein [Acidimicrobiales bacterium]